MASNTIEVEVIQARLGACKTLQEFSDALDDYSPEALTLTVEAYERNYYTGGGGPGLDDVFYDLLESKIKTGPTAPTAPKKRALPVFMDSLEKVRAGDWAQIQRWAVGRELVAMPKLDGVSCLVEYRIGGAPRLYTKGSRFEMEGIDISALSPVLPPHSPQSPGPFFVRGEFIMADDLFRAKYAVDYKNSRAVVSGIVARRVANPDLTFIAYEYFKDPNAELPTKRDQLRLLGQMGFNTVQFEPVTLSGPGALVDLVHRFRRCSPFSLDGVVLYDDSRRHPKNKEGFPSYSLAFKIQGETLVTTVIGVDWKVSKRGFLRPRVHFDPVELGGVTMSWATGFNGKWIFEHGVGKGALVRVIRSGEVIPQILEVIGATEPDMPSDYTWHGVECVGDEDTGPSRLEHFFKTLGASGVGSGAVKKLCGGGLTTLDAIWGASVDDIAALDGFGAVSAQRLFSSIRACVQGVPLARLIAAGAVFDDLGTARIGALLRGIPGIFTGAVMPDNGLRVQILSIPGFSGALADRVLLGYGDCLAFLGLCFNVLGATVVRDGLDTQMEVDEKNGRQVVVFSNFRSAQIEALIRQRGGEVATTVTKKTTLLVVKGSTQSGTKVMRARTLGIRVVTLDDFIKSVN